MKKIKILTIVLAIVLVALVAFGGVYIQTQNRMENKVRSYEFGRELDSQRVILLEVVEEEEEETSDESEDYEIVEEVYEIPDDATDVTEETSESTAETETTIKEESEEEKLAKKESYQTAKKTIENRLKNLGATDYTISLNEETGEIKVEIPEDDYTDMYIYYLNVISNIEVIDQDTEEVLIGEEMVKTAKYTYSTTSSGYYQVYAEIELTKDGRAKLEEILNDYALLATEIDEIEEAQEAEEDETDASTSTESEEVEGEVIEDQEAEIVESENTETENIESESTESQETVKETETTKKIANLTVGDTTYDVSKIEKGKITIKIGSETTSSTYVNNYIAQAAEIALLENSGKMPVEYEVASNRYEYSSITTTQIACFAIIMLIVLVIILLIYCAIYKISGVLASISFIGFVAVFSLLLRYTNVILSIEGICGILVIIVINLKFNQELLSRIKKTNLIKEAVKLTYKDIFSKLIPVAILAIVACLISWESLSSFGMVMFWGLILMAVYNYVVTKTLLELRENK